VLSGPTGVPEQELDAQHQLTVQAAVTFTATGGTPTTKTAEIQLVKLAAPTPSLSRLRVGPRRFSLTGRLVKRHCVVRTRTNLGHRACRRPIALTVSYRLTERSQVTVTVAGRHPGREVRRSCVKPTRTNRQDRTCTRVVHLPGTIIELGKPGANRFTFTGTIGGRRRGAGRYTLTPSGGRAVTTTVTLEG
jgi:hypothetical protein